MSRCFSLIVLLCLAAHAPAQQKYSEGAVTRIVDSSTLEITPKGEKSPIKVSVAYITTPARGKPGYKELDKLASDLLRSRTVRYRLTNEPKNYGRFQVVMLLGSSTDYGAELVKSGWAEPAPGKSKYSDALKEAQEKHRGQWVGKKKR